MDAVTVDEARAAAARVADVVRRTPLVPFASPGDARAEEVWLKLETLQPVGSFKVRGVLHAVLDFPSEERARGLSTVSAGNTAQALAYCGARLGCPARSVMPDGAPRAKVDAVRAWGGEPVLVPRAEVFRFLRERLWEHEPYAFVHPWIDRRVMVGHATLGLEIVEQCPDLETLLVPVGGGALMAGVAAVVKALAPQARVLAVEPEGCATLSASLAAGAPADVECRTACDGVAVPYLTDEVYPLLAALVDDVVRVSESEVERAIVALARDGKVVAEPSGALALAGALALPLAERGRTVCPVTGGSIDATTLVAILGRSAD